MSKEMVAKLIEMIEEHGIRPVIARTFEWDNAKGAFETLLRQEEVGKVVIKV
jgi:NADPH:quinone reductase-like Zn-dependent oxidoreductase